MMGQDHRGEKVSEMGFSELSIGKFSVQSKNRKKMSKEGVRRGEAEVAYRSQVMRVITDLEFIS